MEVQKHQHLLRSDDLSDEIFGMFDLWVELDFSAKVGAVEIPTCNSSSTVAQNHSVRIQHWNYVKIVFDSQILSRFGGS